ncbi:MAG: Lrp/AsnC ligand binding domain-containing protein [Candidatus Nezhaarchaeales archaeon]
MLGKKLMTAYILLRTVIAKEHEVAQAIQGMKGVVEVKVVFGEYDVVVKAQAKNARELDEIVTNIRRINGVVMTSTLIASD